MEPILTILAAWAIERSADTVLNWIIEKWQRWRNRKSLLSNNFDEGDRGDPENTDP